MDKSVAADVEVHEVKFFPPLHEQRRSWALEILRRERITKVGPLGREFGGWVPTELLLLFLI